MSEQTLSTERRILVVMRQVLTSVIKDTTTSPGLKHPLSDSTIDDIRHCLSLLSARDMELAKEAGEDRSARPHFIDEPSTSTVVTLDTSGLDKK